MPSANDIRQGFLDFFVQKHGHTAVPSSSVVPLDDPTLLFTNAGMNQFKDVFLGTGTRPYQRAVDSQKCIRAGGKHNDLEDVGRDTYHHTFFEMLGNWSFGDYFKKEAIRWAWELLTEVWKLDKSRLHVTVFEGDTSQNLNRDDEAAEFWRTETDVAPGHIHLGNKKDNFWMMGDTGPCGPCTEIHIDRTPDRSGSQLVNKGDARVMEIWNLVFIQYNRDDKGQLHLLPAKHVDTGMGFERVASVLQGKESNYDTDVFTPIMNAIGDVVKAKYGGKLEDVGDIAFRVIADHLRMLTFSIVDGALPGNKGRGSVLRSVLRRAVRFGYQCFGQREPFVCKLVPALVEHRGGAYPELRKNPGRIQEILKGEETDFLTTIGRGLSLFESAAKRAAQEKEVITGKAVFDLYTENGFPADLTRQMAQERGMQLDEAEYERLMDEHTRISRTKKTESQVALNVSGGLPTTDDRPKWSGRTCEGTVLGWIADNSYHTAGRIPETEVGLLVDRTAFYAEQGGQVGDQGTLRTPTGLFEISQTLKVGNAVVHVGQLSEGRVEVGQGATLEVSGERDFTRKNHTATHLLHWALHKVLGEHVEQRGSKVKPEEFTFDFAHTGPMTESEKAEVERLVSEKVYADLTVNARELSAAEAKKLPGVKAFFGDKYGDVVRVIEVGDGFSREFCGGTHLEHTGQIGSFKIVSEEAVGKGVRRLTCVTAREAVKRTQQADAILGELTARFRCQPTDLVARIEGLQEEIKKLQQQLKKGAAGDLSGAGDRLLAAAREVAGAKIAVGEVPAAPEDQLRAQVDRLRQKCGSAVIIMGWKDEEKAGLMAMVSDDLVPRGVHAGKLVQEAAKVIGGKGGGRPNLAQAGGKDPSRLAEALDTARALAEKQLGGG